MTGTRLRATLRRILPYLGVWMAAWALFYKALPYEFFVYDDALHIRNNPNLNPLTWNNLIEIWLNSLMPVPYTLWGLLVALFGSENPFPFRAFNLALHATNGVLVAVFIKRFLTLIMPSESNARVPLVSILAALIFVVHPLTVESSVWISAGKHLMSFFFSIIALIFYLNAQKRTERASIYLLGSYTALALACLSTVHAAVLVFIFLWLDLVLFHKPARSIFKEYGAVALILALVMLLYYQLMPVKDIGYVPSLTWRLLIATQVLAISLSKLSYSIYYYFDYGMNPVAMTRIFLENPWHCGIMSALMVLLIGAVIAAYKNHRTRPYHFVLGLPLILMLPVLGIVPFAFQNISTIADRYLYFPLLGMVVLYAALLLRIRSSLLQVVIPVGYALLLAAVSHRQMPIWQSSESMLQYTLLKNPISYNSHVALAALLSRQGKLVEASHHQQEAHRLSFGNVTLMTWPK